LAFRLAVMTKPDGRVFLIGNPKRLLALARRASAF